MITPLGIPDIFLFICKEKYNIFTFYRNENIPWEDKGNEYSGLSDFGDLEKDQLFIIFEGTTTLIVTGYRC